jgi:hypothetical protein
MIEFFIRVNILNNYRMWIKKLFQNSHPEKTDENEGNKKF